MTFGLLAISIIKHITGAAVTPLIIAAQTSALMGSSLVKLISKPYQRCYCQYPIKCFGCLELSLQSDWPSQCLPDGVGCRATENRQRQ